MTLTISDLAVAKSMTDLKADESGLINGGFLFRREETTIYDIEKKQNGLATGGSFVFQNMDGSLTVNFHP